MDSALDTSMWESLFKLIDDLIKPGNWPFLAVFCLVALGAATFLIIWIRAYIQKERLDLSGKFGPLWIHLCGGKDDPKTTPRRYRKLLYVKINLLANQKMQSTPFYERRVARLAEADQIVPVYDEAVYCTLKLFPEKRSIGRECDTSSGVVDPRLVMPWLTQLGFNSELERGVKPQVVIEAKEDSDTMLSVSHFLNGLQGGNQNFCTLADEDAESLRIVVDFSSIPNAREQIQLSGVQLLIDEHPVDSDDLTYRDCGGSVYMAHCKDAKRGSLLKMNFTFKAWDVRPAASKPSAL